MQLSLMERVALCWWEKGIKAGARRSIASASVCRDGAPSSPRPQHSQGKGSSTTSTIRAPIFSPSPQCVQHGSVCCLGRADVDGIQLSAPDPNIVRQQPWGWKNLGP